MERMGRHVETLRKLNEEHMDWIAPGAPEELMDAEYVFLQEILG
jgi:hypothetical protein